MSRTWRLAALVFVVTLLIGGAIAAAVVTVVDVDSQRNAAGARIDAQIAAQEQQETRVEQLIAAHNDAGAKACEDAVRGELKSPSTAQFNVIDNTVAGPRDDNLSGTVTGTVDAQNSFGAMMRLDWTCIVPPGSSVGAMNATISSLVQR